jgi:hypothetical protein
MSIQFLTYGLWGAGISLTAWLVCIFSSLIFFAKSRTLGGQFFSTLFMSGITVLLLFLFKLSLVCTLIGFVMWLCNK